MRITPAPCGAGTQSVPEPSVFSCYSCRVVRRRRLHTVRLSTPGSAGQYFEASSPPSLLFKDFLLYFVSLGERARAREGEGEWGAARPGVVAAHPPPAPGVYSRAKRARGAGGAGGEEGGNERGGGRERERTRETTLLGHIGELQRARARSEQHRAVKPGPLHLVRCVRCGNCGLRRGECPLERDFLAVLVQSIQGTHSRHSGLATSLTGSRERRAGCEGWTRRKPPRWAFRASHGAQGGA